MLVLKLACVEPAFATTTSTALGIINSGSTNIAGYQIEVFPNGVTEYDDGNGGVRSGALPPALTSKVFADLQATLPLTQLSLKPCAKSASFGTKTILLYDNQTSPDISCPADPKAAALYADVQEIQQTTGMSLLRRRQFPLPFTGQKK